MHRLKNKNYLFPFLQYNQQDAPVSQIIYSCKMHVHMNYCISRTYCIFWKI